jgi:hypothetical protein
MSDREHPASTDNKSVSNPQEDPMFHHKQPAKGVAKTPADPIPQPGAAASGALSPCGRPAFQ